MSKGPLYISARVSTAIVFINISIPVKLFAASSVVVEVAVSGNNVEGVYVLH